MPASLALLGGVAGLVLSIGIGAGAGTALSALLPVDPTTIDPLEALAAAVGLVAVGLGLVRRKRLAWWLAISVFVAWLAEPDAIQHPFATALAVACLVVLAADRRRYRVAADRRAVGPVLAAAIVVVAIAVFHDALVDVTGGVWDHLPQRVHAALDAVAGLWLPGGDLDQARTIVSSAAGMLDTGARFALVAVALLALRAVPGPVSRDSDALRARTIARRYAAGALRPFQLGDDKVVFSAPEREGAVVYGEAGRFVVILGDPIGPPPDAAATLRAFASAAELADRRAAAYQVTAAWLPTFRAIGFRTLPIGAEAVIDLSGFDLRGSARANLRHTVARAARGGVAVSWHPDGVGDARLRAQLGEVAAEWRARRRGPELGFTIHPFDPDARVATAVAREADGRPSAFATFQPTGDGTWVLDLMCRRAGTPGALESCIAEAARGLSAAGAEQLSLGLAPLAGLRPNRSAAEWALLAGARVVRDAYDVRGLEFFKSKFAPRWEPRYLAVRSRLDIIGIALALLRLHVAGSGASLARAILAVAGV